MVGGGPVGQYAAIMARTAGMDVTVIEQRAGVIDKACGEGLMPTALAALRDVGVDPDGVPFRGIRYLDASARRQVRASFHEGPGRGVRRTTLLTALQAAAKTAVITEVDDRVLDVEQDASGVRLMLASGGVLETDAVLGCDGLASRVRQAVRLDRPPRARMRSPVRYGLRQHFVVEPWSDDVEVYWATHGEAYVTPVARDLVGVALLGGRGATFGDRMAQFPALRARLASAQPVGQVLGAGPLRRAAVRPMRGRVLLVGDAAGYVDALTGEGLAIGFLGARAAVSALADEEPERYAANWSRITRRFRWSTEALVVVTRPQPLRRYFVHATTRSPRVFEAAVNRLG